MKIPDIIRSALRREDMPDSPDWVDQIIRYSNAVGKAVTDALDHGLAIGDNSRSEVQTVRLTHGQAQLVGLKRLPRAMGVRSIAVGSADGIHRHALAIEPQLIGTPTPGKVKVIAYFCDTSATRVPCTLEFLPEGQYAANAAAPSEAQKPNATAPVASRALVAATAVGPSGIAPAVGTASGASYSPVIQASGDLIYGTAPGTAARLPKGLENQVLTLAGGRPQWLAPTGGGTRRSAGSTAYLSYPMTESALPFANEGTAGAGANLDTQCAAATAALGDAGLFNNGIRLPDTNASRGVYASASNALNVAYPITACFWMNATNGYYSSGFGKLYRPKASGLTTPFLTWCVRSGNNTGNIFFYVGVAGVLHSINTTDGVQPGWHLIHGWYDGANIGVGFDGVTLAKAAQTGALDYGTNGEVWFGQAPGETTTAGQQRMCDPRLYASLLSDATLTSMYRNGLGQF